MLESTILFNLSLKEQLFKLCGFGLGQKLELLYRGTFHGFEASAFHEKCDNIPKTLTVIKAATSGNIFGGYTEAKWDKSNSFKTDKHAFLFSLLNAEKTPVKVKISAGNEDDAIYCDGLLGPIFGAGNDICIRDRADYYTDNYSYFGSTYCLPNYPASSERAKCFLAGSYKFTVQEIEVFHLV